MGGFFIVQMTDANTNTDLRNGVNGDVGCKYPCKVATMVNIELEGTQTVNGVALSENDIVLVNAQDDATENGVYVVSTGQWERGVWFDSQLNVSPGTFVGTYLGTQRSKTIWQVRCNDNPINFGTSEIHFDFIISAGSGGVLFAVNNLSDVENASTSRTNLGLEIGTDVQAQNANLQSFSNLILAANKIIGSSGVGTTTLYDVGSASGNIPQVGTSSATTLLAGLMAIATGSDVTTGTDNTKAISSKALRDASPFSAATNGYYTLPGGIIVQWGRATSVGVGVTQTITLPTPYLTGIYSVSATYKSTSPSLGSPACAETISLTQINVTNGTSGTVDIFWWTVGK